jgi:hypothetical protein
MTFRPIMVSAIILCFPVPKMAVAEPVMVLSYGSNDCARFVRAPRQEKQMYLAWTEGFISGANTRDSGASRMAGMFWHQAANTVWLQNYCTENPLNGFILAAEALRTALGGHKANQ